MFLFLISSRSAFVRSPLRREALSLGVCFFLSASPVEAPFHEPGNQATPSSVRFCINYRRINYNRRYYSYSAISRGILVLIFAFAFTWGTFVVVRRSATDVRTVFPPRRARPASSKRHRGSGGKSGSDRRRGAGGAPRTRTLRTLRQDLRYEPTVPAVCRLGARFHGCGSFSPPFYLLLFCLRRRFPSVCGALTWSGSSCSARRAGTRLSAVPDVLLMSACEHVRGGCPIKIGRRVVISLVTVRNPNMAPFVRVIPDCAPDT